MLVTGAAGFIGSNFVQYILSSYDDVQVISLDKLTYAGSMGNLNFAMSNSNHHFIRGDINDTRLVLKTLRGFKVDTIVHFAAESHVDNSIASPELFLKTNIIGTFNLLHSARQYWLDEMGWGERECRFHHVSTDEVYGSLTQNEPPFTELNQAQPNSPYSASKASANHIVRAYFHTYKLPCTTSNCSNNYGPNQHQEKLIPTVINACMQNQMIPVYGDGSNIRDWLYVEDHCAAIDRIICQGNVGEVYNVGGDCELSNLELVKRICRILNEVVPQKTEYESLIHYVKDRKGHDWRYAIDMTKLCVELGYQCSYSIERGLALTVNFYLNQRRVYGNKMDRATENI